MERIRRPSGGETASEGIRSLFKQAVRLEESTTEELEPDQVRLRPSALSPAGRDRFGRSSAPTTAGSTTAPGAARRRQVDTGPLAPQGLRCADHPRRVLLPGSDEEVAAILRFCADRSSVIRPVQQRAAACVGSLDTIHQFHGRRVTGPGPRLDRGCARSTRSATKPTGGANSQPDTERLLQRARGLPRPLARSSFQFATDQLAGTRFVR